MSSAANYILVTGANSGLGLGICKRLIDDFLKTKSESESLTIIFTTRSSRKGTDTLKILSAHLAKYGLKQGQNRVNFRPENVDLTTLLSVQDLARKLVASDVPYLNAIVLNAGIGGWTGMDWPRCIWNLLLDIRQATTWPTYKLGAVGLVAKPQLPQVKEGVKIEDPPLGEVFCANVFGHYLLAHWLMPLLWACSSEQPGKVVWVGSIESSRHHYNPEDPQALETEGAYESGKRLTDMLVLSQDQPAASKYINDFLSPTPTFNQKTLRPVRTRPSVQVVHPGICATSIVTLYWIVSQFHILGILFARWAGSPWATVTAYTAALAPVWMALASPAELEAKEAEDGGGRAKWGSAVDRFGRASVRRTDVESWGINGSGKPFKENWWAGTLGRKKGQTEATEQDVESFMVQSASAWRTMELLRAEWENRLRRYDQLQK